MHRLTHAVTAVRMAALQAGCSDAGRLGEPHAVAASKASLDASGTIRPVQILDAFGGGLNATLNELSHNTQVAPECRTSTLIAAGGSQTDELDEPGTELYQCCIHPWMRATVTVRRTWPQTRQAERRRCPSVGRFPPRTSIGCDGCGRRVVHQT